MATKTTDEEAVLGCRSCHDTLDRHLYGQDYDQFWVIALGRTHNYWRFKGIWE
jgi:hypothetical protein